MQKDFLSEIGKASGFINFTAQNFSDLGSFWVFCQCLHFILKVVPHVVTWQLPSATDTACILLCLSLFGWKRWTFDFQKLRSSLSMHLVGSDWLGSVHLNKSLAKKKKKRIVPPGLALTTYLGWNECWEVFQFFSKMLLHPETPTCKCIHQSWIREAELLWAAQNKEFIMGIRSYSIVEAGE